MSLVQWRRDVEQTISQHLTAIRSHVREQEAKRRIEAGADLHRLVAWSKRQLQELESGARKELDRHAPSDAVWIARMKNYMRGACDWHADHGQLRRFVRSAHDHVRGWEERSRELLAGTPPPRIDEPAPAPTPAPAAKPAAPPAPEPPAAAPPRPEPVQIEVRAEPEAEPRVEPKPESRPEAETGKKKDRGKKGK